MTQLNETRTVATPLQEAFDYTADFANVAEWDPGVARAARTDSGELGVGSTFDVIVKFGPSETPMKYTITHFEPPQRVVIEGEGSSLTAIDEIEFAAVENGTRITYTADLHFRGLMRFVAPFLGKTLEKVGEKALDGLESKLGKAG